MLNNNKKSQIPDKDLSSRKVIGLSFTCSGAGLTSCPLFIASVTGFIAALPISLAILGIGIATVGLYLLFSGNKKTHNNSDNDKQKHVSENTNIFKDENYNKNTLQDNEHSKEINRKNDESKLIKTDTEHNPNNNFDENNQNRQIHDHNVNIEQNNDINIKNQSYPTNKDNISNNTSGEIYENAALNTKSDVAVDRFNQQKNNNDNSIHIENKNNMTELRRENSIDNNSKNNINNKNQGSSIEEIVGKSNTNDTIISARNKIESLVKPSIKLNKNHNIDIHTQGPNPNLNIKVDNLNLHHVGDKVNLSNLNKNSTIDKNQDAINKNNTYKAMISLNNTNENLGANHMAQVEINKNIVDNEKNIEKPNSKLSLQEEPKDKLSSRDDNNNSIHIENKNSSNSAEDESIDSNITGNIINKGPSIEINENLKETDRTNFKIDGKINDTKNQNTNPIIDGDNPIISVGNINNRTIVDSHTIQGNHPISISGKKNPLHEPKESQSDELTINGNVFKINKQELPPKLESPHELDPEPKHELKPTEEIQIREKFLEYIYPENNKKNVNQKNKQVQGRNAGRANEIPSQIQSKINSIIKDNENAFRTTYKKTKNQIYKELEIISSKLNKLFTEYVLNVTEIEDKDKYTTKLSDISFEEKNDITKVSCKCQIVKDKDPVFDFEFLAGFVKDGKDVTQKPSNLMHNSVSESLRPGKFKFTFKDKNNTPRYVNVDFPIAQPAKNNTY